MRANLISIFLITFTLFIGALVYRVDDLMFADKLSWSEAQSRSQMAPLLQALENQLSNESETLSLTYGQFQDLNKDYSKASGLSKFQMVSTLKNLGGTEWTFDKNLFLENSPVKSWAPSYLSLLLKNVNSSEIRPGGFAAFTLLDPDRRSYLFLLHQMNQKSDAAQAPLWFGVLLGSEFFQSLMDRSKGQVSQVYLVNQLGQALGHSVPEYVGHLLGEDPLVSEVMKSQLGSGSGTFKNLRGESVLGFYEQVPKSNITAVITTPMSSLLKSRDEVRWQLVLAGLGLAFLGTALFVLLYRPEKQIVRVPVPAAAPAAPTVVKAVSPASTAPNPAAPLVAPASSEDLQKERMKAFVQVSSALAHEMRGPMATLLGHATLLKKSAGNSEHLTSIEDLARRSDEILKKLLAFAGEGSTKPEKLILRESIENSLKNFEPIFFRKGIQVHKRLESNYQVVSTPLALTKALESILQNAVDALERNPKKEISIRLEEVNSQIELEISDTGDGVESANLSQVFDPFFSTRKGHAGLGLSMAHGIFRELQGEMSLESEPGRGARLKVLFPLRVEASPAPVAESLPQVKVAESISVPVAPAPSGPMSIPKTFDLGLPQSESLIHLDDQEVNQVLEMDLTPDNKNPLEEKKLDVLQAQSLPPLPGSKSIEPVILASPDAPAPPVAPALGSKINKPKPRAALSASTELDFQIRKPGAKL